MGHYKRWTEEELLYLQENWGSKSIKLIAKNLNRPYEGVRKKASDLGLLNPTLHYDGITVNQLKLALRVSPSTIKMWIRKYNFPAKKKVFSKRQKISVISYQDFWEWAEKHQDLINFAKFEPLILGKEPEWVKIKRNIDKKKYKDRRPWTERDKKQLIHLVKLHQFTYPEIAAMLKRPEASIKRKLIDLNIKARPISLDKHNKYTEKEIKIILHMIEQKYSFNAIADYLNKDKPRVKHKSANGIRGKLERMGFLFRNDMVIAVPINLKKYYD